MTYAEFSRTRNIYVLILSKMALGEEGTFEVYKLGR